MALVNFCVGVNGSIVGWMDNVWEGECVSRYETKF